MLTLTRDRAGSAPSALLLGSAGAALVSVWTIHSNSMFPLIWSDVGAAVAGTLLGATAAMLLAFALQCFLVGFRAASCSAAAASAILAGLVYTAHLAGRSPFTICLW